MALSENDKKRWAEIDQIIEDNKETLQATENHHGLREFAKTQGWNNRADFPKFKHSLRKIGVNYNGIRKQATAERREELAEVAEQLTADKAQLPMIELAAAAMEDEKTGDASYAVTDSAGAALWYGKFFDNDRIRVAGDLVSAEQSAADKAVFVAGKAIEEAGVERAHVTITTTCPTLDTADLEQTGARFNLAVTVDVDNEDYRALNICELPGFKRWKDSDLTGLVATDEDEQETDDE